MVVKGTWLPFSADGRTHWPCHRLCWEVVLLYRNFSTNWRFPPSLYASHKDNYKTLEQETENEVNKAFSLKCLVFSLPGSECRQLLKLLNTKMQCREKRVGMHLKCNKQHLREEVVLQKESWLNWFYSGNIYVKKEKVRPTYFQQAYLLSPY